MTAGTFQRQSSTFRDWVTADPDARFPAQPGRYHLYVSLACPWSHRTVLVRTMKGLEDVVGLSFVPPYRDEAGWRFGAGRYGDPHNGFSMLSEAYHQTDPSYAGRFSVPVLWDTHEGVIVNNESADIMRMLNSAFGDLGNALDLYPEDLRPAIDELNAWVYDDINNGVYRAGFARSQAAYDERFDALFAALGRAEEMLAESRYLTGDRLTEADWRLWVTLIRFDRVYHTHFRCNGRRITDHPSLWGFTRELFQRPGIAETVAWDEILEHYYTTHNSLNPKRLIPRGPLDYDLWAPHGRDHLEAA